MRAICAAFVLLASFNASALCVANTVTVNCGPAPSPSSCGPTTVYNAILATCEPKTCPPGTNSFPLQGGGVQCTAPMQCIDGNGHIGPCNPVSRTGTTTGQPQATLCSMTVTWVAVDPENPTLVTLTPGCERNADLASSRMTTRLLGGR